MFALHLLRVPVTDLAAATAFWTALLGRPPASSDADGVRYDVDGLDIALVPRAPATLPGELGFELDHEDLPALRARLPAGTDATIEEAPDGRRTLAVRDPSGNLLLVRWRMPER